MKETITKKGVSLAYFSMEIAIDPKIPTYSGGLGVLAGDTLRAAADMGLPLVAVTLLYRKGYFKQKIDQDGKQLELGVEWNPHDHLKPLPQKSTIQIQGRKVEVQAYEYLVKGARGHTVPIYFLDTALPSNHAEDQNLSGNLYGGDETYRIRQEVLLGMGGVAMLDALGHTTKMDLKDTKGIEVYHMNEGHAAFLTLALRDKGSEAFVKERCVFTTHTPVPAGHDTFPISLSENVLGAERTKELVALGVCPNGRLNMSELAIHYSRFINGVAKRHAEVSRRMFPGVQVEGITNGVHAYSWTADAIRDLFDTWCPKWKEDNNNLRYVCEVPLKDLKAAHQKAKEALFAYIRDRTSVSLKPDVFTIGFARRAAEYKRADLLFHDTERLLKIAEKRPLQVVFAGKAHPKDFGGKAIIEKVFQAGQKLTQKGLKVVYLEDYGMELGRLITSGVDVWLNNPVKPLEASGTSGMKAAINGVPNLSTLDGWWVEGCIDALVGWEIDDPADAFGDSKDNGAHRHVSAGSIYDRLEKEILPLYYDQPEKYAQIMRNSITINGPYFNTHRMVLQYLTQAYTRAE